MRTLLIVISFFLIQSSFSQDTLLLHMLDDSMSMQKTKTYVTGTFKGVYIINTQSVEAPAKNALIFLIMHRFGKVNDGAYNLFGLDNATMRIGFDYGITNNLSVGVGRSTFEKTFDGHIKYKLLKQTDGSNQMPVTVDLFGGIYYTSLKYSDKPYFNSRYRTSYDASLLIARKISTALSLQITPTLLHYNLVPTTADKNNVFVISTGGRFKLTKRMSVNAEYDYVLPGQVNSYTTYNSLSAGIDIETGGHVFQLHLTNSQGMVEPLFLGKTTGSWTKGNIYFGFNVSRAFNLKH
ncbi:MAG: DUF5777 family beta-barrel protein [Parafilimonas sp.]